MVCTILNLVWAHFLSNTYWNFFFYVHSVFRVWFAHTFFATTPTVSLATFAVVSNIWSTLWKDEYYVTCYEDITSNTYMCLS